MGNASVPSGDRAATRVVLRTVLLLLAFALPGSILDVTTTELARRDGGFVELNPKGFLPLHQSILMELGWVSLCVVVVAVGAHFRREALRAAPDATSEQFVEGLFARHAWAVPLLWMPHFSALFRYPVVISNACYLTLRWSPIDAVLLSPLERLFHDDALAYFVSILVGVLVLWHPATTLIVRALYAVHRAGQNTPQQAQHLTGWT